MSLKDEDRRNVAVRKTTHAEMKLEAVTRGIPLYELMEELWRAHRDTEDVIQEMSQDVYEAVEGDI